MGMEKCVNSFNEATGLELSKEESQNILQTMLRAREAIIKQRTYGGREAMMAAASDLADKKSIAAREAELRVLRDATKRDAVMDQIKTNGGLKNALETLHSILRGSNKIGFGGRDSVENSWHSNRDSWSNAVVNALFKGGWKKVAESGALDKDISVAWWNLSNGKSAGSGAAAEIAKIYSKALDSVRDRQNAAGASIKDAKNYVTTTEWNSTAMRQAAGTAKTLEEAFEAWWAKDSPRMSEKTFNDVVPRPGDTMEDARKEFGRNIFDAFLTGVHMKVGEAETGEVSPDFSDTHNVANKLAAHRAVVWKDGESWHDHMQDFGNSPTLHASVLNSIDRGARSLALLDKVGSNPGAQINMLLRRIQETYRDDADGVVKFQNNTRSVINEIRDLDGTLNIPANMGLERAVSTTLTLEATSTLGGVGITHFASIWPTVTSELAHHGINRFESLGGLFKGLLTGMGDADRRNILSDIGAFADGGYRHIKGKIGDDTVPGHISSMAARFMDMTGIHLVFDRTKAAVRDMLAHNLARNADKSWAELDPHLSDMLGRYRITPEEWDLMRNVKDLPVWNGRKYMTPSGVAEGADEVDARALLQKNKILPENPEPSQDAYHLKQLRQGLSDKLLSYYSDAAKHGVVTSGVRERAFLLQGTQKGTGANAMLRFLTQFKMWPVAAYNQILEREVYTSLSNKEAAWNIGKLLAIGVPAGYLRMSVSDLANGNPLRNPADPKTLLAAAAQSGGLGILGDFLFGEVNRMGGGIMSALAGPVAGDADSLIRIFNKARGDLEGNTHKTGKFGDVWPDLARFGVHHIPFANLVYVKGALDYLLWYHLYEAASPGWWERTNRRIQREQGRTMTGYTPGGGVPVGVPGIYLKNNSGSGGLFGSGNLQ